MAVGHKTGGRQRGTRNKASIEKEQKIAESGLTPLDYMLGVLRDTKATYEMRIEPAKSAAPYVHPKLAALTLSSDPHAPLFPERSYPAQIASVILSILQGARRPVVKEPV